MAALEPGEIGELWLDKHKDTPRASRPVVFTKAPSARQQRALSKSFDEIFEAADPESVQDKATALFCQWVTGWENFPAEYSAEAVEDAFTFHGMLEILRRVLGGAAVTLVEKKT